MNRCILVALALLAGACGSPDPGPVSVGGYSSGGTPSVGYAPGYSPAVHASGYHTTRIITPSAKYTVRTFYSPYFSRVTIRGGRR